MNLHHHEHIPGRLNLIGQQKPGYYLDALTQAEAAWDEYYVQVEEMIARQQFNDANQVNVLNAMRDAAEQASAYKDQMYNRWMSQAELTERN